MDGLNEGSGLADCTRTAVEDRLESIDELGNAVTVEEGDDDTKVKEGEGEACIELLMVEEPLITDELDIVNLAVPLPQEEEDLVRRVVAVPVAAEERVCVLESDTLGVLEGVAGQENTRRALLPVSTMYTAPAPPGTALRGLLSCATAFMPRVAPAAPVPTRVLALPVAVLTTRTL